MKKKLKQVHTIGTIGLIIVAYRLQNICRSQCMPISLAVLESSFSGGLTRMYFTYPRAGRMMTWQAACQR